MPGVAVSAVINAHREGELATASLDSIGAALRVAEAAGLSMEVVAVLDRADEATLALFRGWSAFPLRVIEVDLGDPGLSRNGGVAAARGRWVAFLDADDLWCAHWPTAAAQMAETLDEGVILHPECNVYFGEAPYVMRHPDQDEPGFDPFALLARNPWTVLSFAARTTYLARPFGATRFASGFGYEDWAWNLETIAHGHRHHVVPGTSHAVRQRRRSQNEIAKASGVIPHPVRLI